MNPLLVYLPQDRRQALARGETLPDRTTGTALFADISGFTPLAEALTQAFGPRRGAELLSDHINQVYDTLIAEVDRYNGSVLSFAGDAMTCWFDQLDQAAPARAVSCALAMQAVMARFAAIALPNGGLSALALKTTIASGPARRFVVGDPDRQLMDALAGATIARLAADHLASRGEILIDQPTARAIGPALELVEWRVDADTQERFAVVRADQPQPAEPAVRPKPPASLSAEQLRPWLLPPVYEREQTGHGAFLTEFRPAAALFLRFVGWDYDQPDAGAQLDALIRRAQAVLAQYEGTLLQLNIGDKGSYFYAAFGAPVAHEDDARRAVGAALALRREAAEFEGLAPLQIGLNRGMVRAGAYGGLTRCTYGVLGDEVNLAARLMQAAAPGEILLSGRMQQALAADPSLSQAESFSLEPHPPIYVKGKAEPLPTFTLVGTQRQRAIRLQEPAYALPMVGRTAELDLIAGKMDLALQGQAQVIGISAEAGMGKSRLIAEVIRLARRRNLTGYGGACQADGLHTAYLVWRPIFLALFDLDPAAPLRRQIRTLEGELADLAPDRIEALPLLDAALGLSLPDNDFTRSLEPQFRKSALEALLVDCLRAAASEAGEEGGGLLLVLEDLHWLDPASRDLLAQVAQATVNLPVLIVLAYRPAEMQQRGMAEVERLPDFTAIQLAELNAAESEQAIRAKLAQLFPERSGTVPPTLIERVTARAQGNPFYLEELLNYLRDRGIDPLSARASGRLVLELPASLHSLILSRIDQLTTQQQLTLKVASVIGRVFRFDHLRDYYLISSQAEVIKTDLEVLCRLELTSLEMPEPELTYLFKHIITREVAYESLPYETRSVLHEQYARYLETQGGPEVDRYLHELAYHYDHSNNLLKRQHYLRLAGETAARRYTNAVAIDYLTRALALTTSPAARFDLLLTRTKVFDRQGDREGQQRDIEALGHLAETLDAEARRAEVALQQAIYTYRISDYPACIAASERAVRLGQAANALDIVVEARYRWAWALVNQNDYDTAGREAALSLELARRLGNRQGETQALRTVGVIVAYLGDSMAGRAYCEQSLKLAREVGDRAREGEAINSLGVIANKQGDFAVARTCFEQRLHIAHEIGDQRARVTAFNNLGALATNQGQDSLARTYYEQCLSLAAKIGDRQGEAIVLGNLGNIAARQQQYAAARTYYEQTMAISQAIGSLENEGWSLWGLGNVELALGRPFEAADAYRRALTMFRELKDSALAMEALAGLARVALAQADPAQAQSRVDEILSYLKHGNLDGAEEPFWVYLTCYQVLAAAHDPRAEAILTTAYDLLQDRAAGISDETGRRMFLENISHHRELVAAWVDYHPA